MRPSIEDDPLVRARWEAAGVWAERVRLEIAYGAETRAGDLLRHALAETRAIGSDTQPLRQRPLAVLCDGEGMGLQQLNALQDQLGLETIGDLLATPREALLAIPNFGAVRLAEVLEAALRVAAYECERLEAALAREGRGQRADGSGDRRERSKGTVEPEA